MKIFKKILALGCAFVMACGVGCGGGTKSVYDERNLTPYQYSYQNVTGTDGLDREIDTVTEKNDKIVGMFWFLCHGSIPHEKPYNVEEMLANGLKDELFKSNSKVAPAMKPYYWNEPVFGYYHSEDEWVFRRQVAMLSWAGVDFLALDVTNGYTYDEVWWMYLRVLDELQQTGVEVPKVIFLTNNNMNERVPTGTNVVKYLYDQLYSKGLYKNLWFSLDGQKPLIAANKTPSNGEGPTQDMYDFFDIRQTVWPNEEEQDYNGFPWISFVRPQENYNGIMSVSVCQHQTTMMSNSYYYKGNKYFDNWGRGWTDETGNTEEGILSGANIAEQWETVYANKDAVNVAFVCGWNEWTAYKFDTETFNNGLPYWVDQFNDEFSRDIEPTTGALKDNYFMQFCESIRKFKRGDADYSIKVDASEIDMNNEASWIRVKEQYVNVTGTTMDRNFKGAPASEYYTDTSGRNDIESIKVAYDSDNLYFRVSTVEDVTAYESGDDKWMNIYIGTDSQNAWNGFGYVVNRTVNGNKTSLHKLDKDGNITLVSSDVELKVSGKNVYVAIHLDALGLKKSNINIDFKVTDNVQNQTDILSHYVSGCSAPIGGLSFNYKNK